MEHGCVVRMPPDAEVVRKGVEAPVNEMSRYGASLQRGLDPTALTIGQAPAHQSYAGDWVTTVS